MTPTARRHVIEVLTTEHELSVRRACRVVGLARTAWYTPPADPAVRDAEVIEALMAVVANVPTSRSPTGRSNVSPTKFADTASANVSSDSC